jgi:hypothetical protein
MNIESRKWLLGEPRYCQTAVCNIYCGAQPKFEPEIRTSAMQAGWVSKQLSFKEVFAAVPERTLLILVFMDATMYLSGVRSQKMVA